jgi:hypothetical protein
MQLVETAFPFFCSGSQGNHGETYFDPHQFKVLTIATVPVRQVRKSDRRNFCVLKGL